MVKIFDVIDNFFHGLKIKKCHGICHGTGFYLLII